MPDTDFLYDTGGDGSVDKTPGAPDVVVAATVAAGSKPARGKRKTADKTIAVEKVRQFKVKFTI